MARSQGLVLAVDLGTSAAKLLAISVQGQVAAEATVDYPLHHPQPGWAEQDPNDWWRAVVEGCRRLFRQGVHPGELLAVGLSGQMQNCLLVDGEGQPLGRAILYSDGRGDRQARRFVEQVGQRALWRVTGNPFDASATLAKLLWLKEREPERLQQARWVLPGAKDWVVYRLTGQMVTDPTNASTTGMMRLKIARWDEDLLQEAGISPHILPRLSEAHACVGHVTPEAAEETGLPSGLPVICGAGDAGCATLGAAAVSPERAYCYVGTTGWVATVATEPSSEPREGAFCLRHPDPRYYISVGPLLNAGSAYQWARDTLALPEGSGEAALSSDEAYALMETWVSQVEAGSGGVIFLPYLAGERSPFRDLDARGVFFGLSSSTRRGHLLRAVQEGVAYGIRHIMDSMSDLSHLERLVFIGGGSRSATWSQILADVTGCRIAVPHESVGGPALGAAVCALVGVGVAAGYEAVDQLLQIKAEYGPDPRRVERYRQLYAIYRELYPALREAYGQLAEAASQA